MSTQNLDPNMDPMMAALLRPSVDINSEAREAVSAEDFQGEGGIDFSLIFFEPQVGNSYIVKALPNPAGLPMEHRRVYKNLPDPKRKGKKFHYVSSGNAKTCEALDLFFRLNTLKKAGDTDAEKKIEDYMSNSAEGCIRIQVLDSPKPEEIGIFRLFKFGTYGPNPYISTLLDQKLNPSKVQIKAGNLKEDIYDPISSSALLIVCTEDTIENNKKIRSLKGSSWTTNKRGAMIKQEDGTFREFKAADRNPDGTLVPDAIPAFLQLCEELKNPNVNMVEQFIWTTAEDPRISKEKSDHIRTTLEKVAEIVPIIEHKSLQEIALYGAADTTAPKEGEKPKARDIMAESVPSELTNMVGQSAPASAPASAPVPDDVAAILAAGGTM